ncbi:hypothetical protein, partial [Clostridium sp.]|uniref:hypothetical protein n=1 Tax=Clostridium sp. TaxID=1506 RepID=UPI00260AB10C
SEAHKELLIEELEKKGLMNPNIIKIKVYDKLMCQVVVKMLEYIFLIREICAPLFVFYNIKNS